MKKLLFCCLAIFSISQTGLEAQGFQSEKMDSLFHFLLNTDYDLPKFESE
jgi:hypothetical protein